MRSPSTRSEREALLELSRVSLSYPDRAGQMTTVLANVDLKILDGDFVCLLGPSGCGKTTLLKLFGGFLRPTSGGVLFQGRELAGSTPQIVMVFQEPNLYPWLSVEKNVSFGPRMAGKPRAQIKVQIDNLLKTVGLSEARHRYPHQLSGGMRQRTAIARALATEPQALLLDEPFSSLDVVLRRRMQAFIRDIWESNRATMIMVTHSIEEALLCGQRVIVLGGRPSGIVEDVDVSAPELKDRYSKAFADVQRRLEAFIDAPDEGVAPAPGETTSGGGVRALVG
jgi:ABC-type nitrate/sulfonate/bicarbonate transport system ATPase subunit